MLEKTQESLLDCKEIKAVNPKGNQFQHFGHLMQRADLLEKTLMLGRIEGRRRRGRPRMRWLDNVINSVNMSLRKSRKPGVLQSAGSDTTSWTLLSD